MGAIPCLIILQYYDRILNCSVYGTWKSEDSVVPAQGFHSTILYISDETMLFH